MGKVKVYTHSVKPRDFLRRKYQSPMGKVKMTISGGWEIPDDCVSIPYGKGKEQHCVLCFYYIP